MTIFQIIFEVEHQFLIETLYFFLKKTTIKGIIDFMAFLFSAAFPYIILLALSYLALSYKSL